MAFKPLVKFKSHYFDSRHNFPLQNSEHILFVDDEQVLVMLNEALLRSMGYQVTGCTKPADALQLFNQHPDRCDLVITDLTMPEMTGLSLAEKVHKTAPSKPIILCTGFSSSLDEGRAASIGIRAIINKPILKRQLAGTVRRLLDEK